MSAVDADVLAPVAGFDPGWLLESLPDPVVVVDADTRVLWANDLAARWSGWTLEEWRGRSALELVHPDDVLTGLASLVSVQAKDVGTAIELRISDSTGSYTRFEVRGRSLELDDGSAAIVLALRNVTDRRRWELATGSPDALGAVLDNAPAITMLLDADGRIRSTSRAVTALLGHPVEAATGRSVTDLVLPADRGRVRCLLDVVTAEPSSTVAFEAGFLTAHEGSPVPLGVTVVNLLDDAAVTGLLVTAVDITDLAETRERLRHLATHDALTGLPNRTLLVECLEAALARARRRGSVVGVVYCDVVGFKRVNDDHGHAAGDEALSQIARRMRHCARSGDTVARIGGDEFVVVVEGDDPVVVAEVAERMQVAVREPISLSGGPTAALTLSCGWAVASDLDDPDSVLDAADAAMYRTRR